jgi:hypothetical protein
MVAVEAFIQSRGGVAQAATALPNTRVLRTREFRMARRFAAPYRQFTLRPARLMSRPAPSSSRDHSPMVSPSQAAMRHGARRGFRESTVTACPAAW